MLSFNRAVRCGACLIAAAVLGTTALPARAEVVDRILATVDTEVILLSDVMRELRPVVMDVRTREQDPAIANRIIQSHIDAALEQAIDERILLREAKLAGMEVREDMIEQQLNDLIKRYPSREAFLRDMEESGETMKDMREYLRRRLLARGMAAEVLEKFSSNVTVSESEVADYYAEHSGEFAHPERVRIRQIFLSAPQDSGERAAAKARLETLREQILEGADFSELARAYSEAPGADDGGIVGWVIRGDLLPALDAAAFALQEGEISPVVETNMGVHLLKADEREEAGVAPLSEARTVIEPRIRAQKSEQRYETWMADLRKRSKVRVFNR